MNGITLKNRRYDELVMNGTRGVDQVAVFITGRGKPITYTTGCLHTHSSDLIFKNNPENRLKGEYLFIPRDAFNQGTL